VGNCETALLAACTPSDANNLAYDALFRPMDEIASCDELQAAVEAGFADAGVTSTCNAALQEQIALLSPILDAG
jgi:hypothetical protein